MSEFSQLLALLMSEKDIKTYALAQYCGYDRANMYKIINGKRNPPSIEFVDRVSKYMHLSPIENKKLREAYKITIEGYDNYYRRKDVMNFFSEFMLTSNLDSSIPSADYNAKPQDEKEIVLLNGSYEISSALYHLIAMEANKDNGHIRLLIQPEFDFVMNILASQGNCTTCTRLDHIICFNNKPETIHSKKNYNLTCLKNILPIFNYNYDYHTYYYYDSIFAKNGAFSLFPYMIITSQHACILTADMQKGYQTKNPSILVMLAEIFDDYLDNSSPLLRKSGDIFEQLTLANSLAAAQSPGYCFQMTPCISHTLTPELLEKYLKPNVFNRSEFISQFTAYTKQCSKLRETFPVTFIFSMEGIIRFLDTGKINEYPSDVYNTFSLSDRIYILKRLLLSDRSPTVKILKHNIGNFDAELYLYVTREQGYLVFTVPARNTLVYLDIEEPGLLSTFYDFCETLDPGLFYSPEEATALVHAELQKREKGYNPS